MALLAQYVQTQVDGFRGWNGAVFSKQQESACGNATLVEQINLTPDYMRKRQHPCAESTVTKLPHTVFKRAQVVAV
jgi:hypothetical protein